MMAIAIGGAALGLLMGSVLMGRASADAPPAGRYAYKCLNNQSPDITSAEAQNMLNVQGSQGYRLLETRNPANAGLYCFERRF
jgi:hypothetical protein